MTSYADPKHQKIYEVQGLRTSASILNAKTFKEAATLYRESTGELLCEIELTKRIVKLEAIKDGK